MLFTTFTCFVCLFVWCMCVLWVYIFVCFAGWAMMQSCKYIYILIAFNILLSCKSFWFFAPLWANAVSEPHFFFVVVVVLWNCVLLSFCFFLSHSCLSIVLLLLLPPPPPSPPPLLLLLFVNFFFDFFLIRGQKYNTREASFSFGLATKYRPTCRFWSWFVLFFVCVLLVLYVLLKYLVCCVLFFLFYTFVLIRLSWISLCVFVPFFFCFMIFFMCNDFVGCNCRLIPLFFMNSPLFRFHFHCLFSFHLLFSFCIGLECLRLWDVQTEQCAHEIPLYAFPLPSISSSSPSHRGSGSSTTGKFEKTSLFFGWLVVVVVFVWLLCAFCFTSLSNLLHFFLVFFSFNLFMRF